MAPVAGWPVWFTADTHLQHVNISDYVRRPYASTSDMDADIIRRWNAVVSPRDLVYHLGDFAMGLPANWAALRRQLNGYIVLVLGNHDRSRSHMLGVGFDDVVRNAVVQVDGVRVWLNHYPVRPDGMRGPRRPSATSAYDIAVCGHVHDAWLVANGVVNVGVDVWDFAPTSLPAIMRAHAGHQ
jgi:calcineurin-like phosphoesterase family protein